MKLRTLWVWLGLLAAAPALLPLPVSGQGLKPTPTNDYQALPVYDPTVVTVRVVLPDGSSAYEQRQVEAAPLPPKHDLGEYLPRPGRQAFGDCTGWAVSRGAYTYQFAKSRWRKPQERHDLFSPAFIYSQINGGEDSGSFIHHSTAPNAVDLIRASGCATEATMPYDGSPGAWQTQPSARARREAGVFPAVYHERLADLSGVKYAITQNVPVVLGVRTDERFHDAADTAIYRWSGDPASGHHAICAVGYDDSKNAVKLMNSWGDSWKNDGFCWVDYSEFETFAPGRWCFEAHLIRVLDENLPKVVSVSDRRFTLESDGSVTEEGSELRPAGYAVAGVGTKKFPYVARPDGRVFTLARSHSPTGTVTEFWDDVASGDAPHGLGGQQVSMLAATDGFLYVLTRSKRIYARVPGINDQRVWDDLPLPDDEVPADIRTRDGKIHVVTESGRVFHRIPGQWVEN